MTNAVQHALAQKPNASFHSVLKIMRNFLKDGGYAQVPQMSSERPVKLDATFRNGPGLAKLQRKQKRPGAAKPRRKALSIAINYIGQRGELRGCINDQATILALWKSQFGVPADSIRTLRDDDPNSMPTKANMLAAMQWLVEGACSGDELFLHYSGHGGQMADTSGD